MPKWITNLKDRWWFMVPAILLIAVPTIIAIILIVVGAIPVLIGVTILFGVGFRAEGGSGN